MSAMMKAALPVLVVVGSPAGWAQAPACTGVAADLQAMVQTEYAFATRAQTSVREAFLENLAADSLVLGPGPTPGRAYYEAAKPNDNKLEWYPSAAAAGGGLGFTTGPWVYTGASGNQAHGHFVTVWKRDSHCRWRAEFDGGISHAAPSIPEPKLDPFTLPGKATPASKKTIAGDAADKAIGGFQRTALQDDLAAGFKTYARGNDFRFYFEGEVPMTAEAAAAILKRGSQVASWSENVRGHSSEGSVAYAVGEFTDVKKGERHSYLQIWQYDPNAEKWGLRIFLQTP